MEKGDTGDEEHENSAEHPRTLSASAGSRKRGRGGYILLEAILSLSILTVIGLLILKLSMNILVPRQWTLQQTLSDAYLTFEKASAQRIPFEELTAVGSPWPEQPQSAVSVIEMGRLPGGQPLTATVFRTRVADVNNPVDTQPQLPALNPAAMKIWRVQSVVTYRVGSRTYVKSRTVTRAQ